MVQLHHPDTLEEIAALDGRLLVVSFAALPKLQEWVPYFRQHFLERFYKESGLELPADPFARTRFASDPQLTAYHAYGLGRNSALKVYGPKLLWQYARWTFQGKLITKLPDDPLQRGGDFVVSRDGRLTLSYVGRDQSDRPAVADILTAMRK